MAEVAFPRHHTRYSSNAGPFASAPAMSSPAPRIEMMANPDFVFPRSLPTPSQETAAQPRRPLSFHCNNASQPSVAGHRRAKSTMPLPSFSFNPTNTSGLQAGITPPETLEEVPSVTPSRGHKRTTSEFVGGDSRLLPTAVNVSPAPASQPIQISSRPNHRHRRSAAISSHDVSNIMQSSEPLPRLSSSAPNSPMEFLTQSKANDDDDDPFGPAIDDDAPTRPPSRRQVEFSDKLEFIPRPLSTISSGTESSMSTIRGHSVNNSISSMLSLGTPSPPSMRAPVSTLETTMECDPSPDLPSVEKTKRNEREGQWLKSATPRSTLPRPISEPLSNTFTFASQDSPIKACVAHNAEDSRPRGLEVDRRNSEPAIRMLADEQQSRAMAARSRQSFINSPANDTCLADRRSSTRKLKDWAVSKMTRTGGKRHARGQSEVAPVIAQTFPAREDPVQAKPPPITIPPVAETDLDAVFGGQASPRELRAPDPGFMTRLEKFASAPSHLASGQGSDSDGFMLDLDAALGPFQTPNSGAHRTRRELHSSRLGRDFTGFGGPKSPNLIHRRTESAPMLTPFEHGRLSTPPQPGMADVFEEDEEDEQGPHVTIEPASTQLIRDEESGIGIQIVDADSSANVSPMSSMDAFRVHDGDWEPERPTTAYGNVSSRLSTPVMERRASSLIEETIIEESSPTEPEHPMGGIEIVQADEEPRAPSFTKSSDSSETPTLMGPTDGLLHLPNIDGTKALTSPESFQTSTFSSPEFGRGQSSFDTSRLGTSASSVTDNRTMSSYATGEHMGEVRKSVDDVPSLTSSRSTMLSTTHANNSRREFSDTQTPSTYSAALEEPKTIGRRRKRQSIQSLSQLVGGSFGSKSNISDASRPQTANAFGASPKPAKKEHRLKKLMFWNKKHRQSAETAIHT